MPGLHMNQDNPSWYDVFCTLCKSNPMKRNGTQENTEGNMADIRCAVQVCGVSIQRQLLWVHEHLGSFSSKNNNTSKSAKSAKLYSRKLTGAASRSTCHHTSTGKYGHRPSNGGSGHLRRTITCHTASIYTRGYCYVTRTTSYSNT